MKLGSEAPFLHIHLSIVSPSLPLFSLPSLNRDSVPCRPVVLLPSLNCSTNSAHVQWSADSGAESYRVLAAGTRGLIAGCNTTRTSCDVSNLLCGDVYNISVAAVSGQCIVTNSVPAQLHTGWFLLLESFSLH